MSRPRHRLEPGFANGQQIATPHGPAPPPRSPRSPASRWLARHFRRIAPGLATTAVWGLAAAWHQQLPAGSTEPLWLMGTMAGLSGLVGLIAATKQHGSSTTMTSAFGAAGTLATDRRCGMDAALAGQRADVAARHGRLLRAVRSALAHRPPGAGPPRAHRRAGAGRADTTNGAPRRPRPPPPSRSPGPSRVPRSPRCRPSSPPATPAPGTPCSPANCAADRPGRRTGRQGPAARRRSRLDRHHPTAHDDVTAAIEDDITALLDATSDQAPRELSAAERLLQDWR